MKDIILLPKKDRNKLYYWAEFFNGKEVIMCDYKEDKVFPWAVFWTGVCLICFAIFSIHFVRAVDWETVKGIDNKTEILKERIGKAEEVINNAKIKKFIEGIPERKKFKKGVVNAKSVKR